MATGRSPEIFYPHHIDLWKPIHTIHRNVATQLEGSYQFVAFHDQEEDEDTNIEAINLATDASKWKKATTYLRTYLRKYDLVHTGPSPRHKFARLSSIRGAKIVHSLHIAPQDPKTVERQRELAKQADAVTAVSPYVSKWAQTELGVDDVHVIPNGVDLGTYQPNRAPTAPKTVGFVGRYTNRKHPDLVLDLAKELPDTTFKIRSEGIPEKAEDHSNVEIVPRLSEDELAAMFAEVELLLCPFEQEGFGMVVLEAMASGTPVIGLNDGNLPHLIDASNGVLCNSLATDTWINAIREARNDLSQFTVRKTAEEYSWPRVASDYDNLYRDLL